MLAYFAFAQNTRPLAEACWAFWVKESPTRRLLPIFACLFRRSLFDRPPLWLMRRRIYGHKLSSHIFVNAVLHLPESSDRSLQLNFREN